MNPETFTGKIVYTSGGDLFTINVDGSGTTQLTTGPADDTFLDWSPNGSKIVFSSNRGGDYDLYIMNADSSGITQLTQGPSGDVLPSWSPDSIF